MGFKEWCTKIVQKVEEIKEQNRASNERRIKKDLEKLRRDAEYSNKMHRLEKERDKLKKKVDDYNNYKAKKRKETFKPLNLGFGINIEDPFKNIEDPFKKKEQKK